MMSSRAYDRYWEKLDKEREREGRKCPLTEEDQRAYEIALKQCAATARERKRRAFADD